MNLNLRENPLSLQISKSSEGELSHIMTYLESRESFIKLKDNLECFSCVSY